VRIRLKQAVSWLYVIQITIRSGTKKVMGWKTRDGHSAWSLVKDSKESFAKRYSIG